MSESAFTDAARFKQLSIMLLNRDYTALPKRAVVAAMVKDDPGLKTWMRQYGKPSRFMNQLKIFFYREYKKAPKEAR